MALFLHLFTLAFGSPELAVKDFSPIFSEQNQQKKS